MAAVRRTVWYSGRVQGVGFRATAHHVARRHRVTGWVRNLPNGQVQMVVEGEESAVDPFLTDLAGRMASNIGESRIETAAATHEFADFGVRF